MMKITSRHYKFWCERKTKVSWYAQPQKGKVVSIHELIPEKDAMRDPNGSAGTLLYLCRCWRRQGKDLFSELKKVSEHPSTLINPARRRKLARKWAERILKANPVGRFHHED